MPREWLYQSKKPRYVIKSGIANKKTYIVKEDLGNSFFTFSYPLKLKHSVQVIVCLPHGGEMMIHNIEDNSWQTYQLPEAGSTDNYSIQQTYSFSYSSSIVIQTDQVSLGHHRLIPSLDRFENHIQKALEGFSDLSKKLDSIGLYPESESPASFAGRFLRRIWSDFLGGVGEGSAMGTETETPVPVQEGIMEGIPVEEVVPLADDIVPESIPEDLDEPVAPETAVVVEDAVAVEEEAVPVVTEPKIDEEPDIVPIETKDETIDESLENEPDKQALVNQVEDGVDKGFQETVKELAIENSSQKEVDTVDNAHKLIKKGLRALKNRLAGSQKINDGYIKNMGFSESNTVNLEILTQDGDVVTIGIEHNMGAEVNRYRNDDTGQGEVHERAGYLNEFLTFSINGDLDEDEHDAISELISDIASLADTFYNGDMSAAFVLASELGFDTAELKGFSLDMSSQKIGYINFIPRRAPSEVTEDQGRHFDFLRSVERYARKFTNHSAFGMFQHPQSAVLDIFKAISIQKEAVLPDMVDKAADLLSALMADEPLEEGDIQVGINGQEGIPGLGQIDEFI